ncbi:MAG: tRNA pseudouridine38-40 synthase [Ilumatobacter sp.]|jgi:tRNA pseudouridine38-40 synthase
MTDGTQPSEQASAMSESNDSSVSGGLLASGTALAKPSEQRAGGSPQGVSGTFKKVDPYDRNVDGSDQRVAVHPRGVSLSSVGRRNVALLVAYDGTDFHGFAESNDVVTVMGVLRSTLEHILQVPLDLTAAGRTDAGVHGWGQVVTGRFPEHLDLARMQRSINRMCAPSIAIRSAEWAPESFDARFSATSRAYRYDIWGASQPNPMLARTSWHVPYELDLDAMNVASTHLLGEHDFASFCRRPKVGEGYPEKSLVRIMQRVHWHRVPLEDVGGADVSPLLRFEIAASSFCHQMVRSVVGTLVEVGRGRRSSDSIVETLGAHERSAAGPVAPPTGLVLWHVSYEGERWDQGRSGFPDTM